MVVVNEIDNFSDIPYPAVFIYLLFSIICLVIPFIDLFMYVVWIRWSMKEKESKDEGFTKIPFPLNYFYFVSNWKDESYNGITDLLWNFAKIGWKGVFVSFSWPFWAIPLTIVTVIFLFFYLLTITSNLLFAVLLGRTPYEIYEDVSDLDDTYDISDVSDTDCSSGEDEGGDDERREGKTMKKEGKESDFRKFISISPLE